MVYYVDRQGTGGCTVDSGVAEESGHLGEWKGMLFLMNKHILFTLLLQRLQGNIVVNGWTSLVDNDEADLSVRPVLLRDTDTG